MKRLRLPLLTALLTAALIASLTIGRYPLSLGDLMDVILGHCDDSMKRSVFLTIRLPRTLLACLSGMALSLAGWVYQSIFMNTLVSPDVLGVSSGCAVGAIAAILSGLSAASIQALSLISGVATVLLTLSMARAVGRNRSVAMLLSGVVVGALANSVIMLLKYAADPNGELAAIEYWLMGSFHTSQWSKLTSVLPVLLPGFLLVFALRHPIRLLSLGDEEAQSLGVRVGPVKYVSLLAATALVAGVVSVAGSVSWLGLIVPHLCHLSGGERSATPFETALAGGFLLTIADLAARSLTSSEIPISILTSFMGAAFLLVVLLRQTQALRRSDS